MKTVAQFNLQIATLLLIIHLNFALLAITVGALCTVLELDLRGNYFFPMSGLAAMTAVWLSYRLRKLDVPFPRISASVIYPLGMVLSFMMALLVTVAFNKVAPTTRWMDLVLLSNGLFLVLCIAIKMNDARYMLD